MSGVRAHQLYLAQIKLMIRMNIPLVDMYLITLIIGHRTLPGDGRHYDPEFNRILFDLYFDTEGLKP